jgi:hypothetical protein
MSLASSGPKNNKQETAVKTGNKQSREDGGDMFLLNVS